MSQLLIRWVCFLLLCAGLAAGSPASAAPTFPMLSGRVVDRADILSQAEEAELSSRLEDLEARTSRQLVVVTVDSLQGYEIAEYGYQLGRAWGIGEAKRDTGVLMVVAPAERQVRIEVGYGLEPIVTDALARIILETDVLPHFRNGRMAEGVIAGTDALIAQLSLPQDQAEARARDVASGDATEDPVSLFLIGLIAAWLIVGLFGAVTGHRADFWFWPLFFLVRSSGGGRRDMFRGRGGSFGGGGASGRW